LLSIERLIASISLSHFSLSFFFLFVRIRLPDPTRRRRPTIPPHPDATRRLTLHDATGRPEPPIAPLFHSKSLNCNRWYLLDLLSNKSFDIAPFQSSLRLHQQDPISHTRRVLTIASISPPFPLSLRLHQQDPMSHTRRDDISRPIATGS
jgi:hypothetical protein